MATLIGKTLKNRYRVDELLGRGGMAEVYKVYDLQRGVPLAMKVLREDLAEDRVFLRRFQREAQNLAKLQHPNIVRFYGLEQEDRLAFILMEYIEGSTLRGKIFDAHGPLTDREVLEIMEPVCSALSYAHQQGIVHCDLKSANIMIDKAGKVYLTDFGIARMTDMATSTMVGVGTPAYMAPELIRGGDPSPQTDIYALGILLYEMVSGGERPFTGERATITGTTAEKVRWEQVNLDFSGELLPGKISIHKMDVVERCLQKDPGRRFSDMGELLGNLKATRIVHQKVDAQPVNDKKEKKPSGNIQEISESKVINRKILTWPNVLNLAIAWIISVSALYILDQIYLLFVPIVNIFFLFIIGGLYVYFILSNFKKNNTSFTRFFLLSLLIIFNVIIFHFVDNRYHADSLVYFCLELVFLGSTNGLFITTSLSKIINSNYKKTNILPIFWGISWGLCYFIVHFLQNISGSSIFIIFLLSLFGIISGLFIVYIIDKEIPMTRIANMVVTIGWAIAWIIVVLMEIAMDEGIVNEEISRISLLGIGLLISGLTGSYITLKNIAKRIDITQPN